MLSVCVSSSELDYCTCADVMYVLFQGTSTAFLGSTGELDYIGRLVRSASRQADQYVQYTLAAQVYSESLAGYGGRRLMLSRCPLVKILRMFDATDTGSASPVCSTEYVVQSADAGILTRSSGWRWTADFMQSETCFNLGLTATPRVGDMDAPWYVEYVAGYKVAGTTSTALGISTADREWSTGATLPQDITQAVALRAAQQYANPQNVAERAVGDLMVRYRVYGSDTTRPQWAQLLDPYVHQPFR